jgi:hypothetical protein
MYSRTLQRHLALETFSINNKKEEVILLLQGHSCQDCAHVGFRSSGLFCWYLSDKLRESSQKEKWTNKRCPSSLICVHYINPLEWSGT